MYMETLHMETIIQNREMETQELRRQLKSLWTDHQQLNKRTEEKKKKLWALEARARAELNEKALSSSVDDHVDHADADVAKQLLASVSVSDDYVGARAARAKATTMHTDTQERRPLTEDPQERRFEEEQDTKEDQEKMDVEGDPEAEEEELDEEPKTLNLQRRPRKGHRWLDASLEQGVAVRNNSTLNLSPIHREYPLSPASAVSSSAAAINISQQARGGGGGLRGFSAAVLEED